MYGSKNGHQTNMFLEKIELHTQNMLTNLEFNIHIIGETYITLNWSRDSSLLQWIR